MENCIFCKVIKGELPSSKIYEDADVFAFLDIAPVNIGHTLVIPKKHFVNIYETPEEILASLIKAAKIIAKAVKSEMKADGVSVIISNDKAAGQVVFHLHMHIIPRFEGDGLSLWHSKRGYKDGEKDEVAKKIIAAL